MLTLVETVSVGSTVRIYHDEDWYDEGAVTEITGSSILVDFADWIQCWDAGDLRAAVIHYKVVFIPTSEGIRTADFS
jgi:hypothetical protein